MTDRILHKITRGEPLSSLSMTRWRLAIAWLILRGVGGGLAVVWVLRLLPEPAQIVALLALSIGALVWIARSRRELERWKR